jgi:hypothetical protein
MTCSVRAVRNKKKIRSGFTVPALEESKMSSLKIKMTWWLWRDSRVSRLYDMLCTVRYLCLVLLQTHLYARLRTRYLPYSVIKRVCTVK